MQTFEQFENDGCENCEAFLALRHNRENVYDCTSSNFEGMVGMAKPDDSWVAKWQRISESERMFLYLNGDPSLYCSLIKIFRSVAQV